MAKQATKHNGFALDLAKFFRDNSGNPIDIAARKMKIGTVLDNEGNSIGADWGDVNSTLEQRNAFDNLVAQAADRQDIGADGVTLGQLGKLGMDAASAHPFATAGAVGTTAMNLGGLFDGNGIGGQLGGAGLGALGSYLLNNNIDGGISPYTKFMLVSGGGALGSLFDKLRAKQDQQQIPQKQYGGR